MRADLVRAKRLLAGGPAPVTGTPGDPSRRRWRPAPRRRKRPDDWPPPWPPVLAPGDLLLLVGDLGRQDDLHPGPGPGPGGDRSRHQPHLHPGPGLPLPAPVPSAPSSTPTSTGSTGSRTSSTWDSARWWRTGRWPSSSGATWPPRSSAPTSSPSASPRRLRRPRLVTLLPAGAWAARRAALAAARGPLGRPPGRA